MAEWLILQLSRSVEEQCGWMLADERGQALSAPRVGSLAEAASDGVGRRVAALVPSSDVLMTDVELPPVKGSVRAHQVAPYALEEQLAADIETLHFAVGARDEATERTAVAVVTRELMNQWLEALQAVGLTPEVVCAEAALLPDNPGFSVVMLDRDTLSVRRAGATPLALPAGDIGPSLEASLGADLSAENVLFYSTPQEWHRHSAEAETLRARCASFKIQLMNAGPLPLLAPQLMSAHFINLLGGDYAPKSSLTNDWRRWRLAAGLALALLVVHVTGLSFELVHDQRNEKTLDDAIGNVARRSIPGDPGTGAVRSRVEQRLLAAQKDSSNSGLLPALTAVAQAVNGINGASLQSLNYHKDGVELRFKTHDAASLDRIDQNLRTNGWQAELTSGAASGSDYEGRIEMRPLGSVSNPRRSR
jgi:general secretion pathway protein L